MNILSVWAKWREKCVAEKVRDAAHRANEAEREKQDRQARHKAALIHAELGYNIDSEAQGWARNAELMRQYRDDIAALKARVAALEAAASSG